MRLIKRSDVEKIDPECVYTTNELGEITKTYAHMWGHAIRAKTLAATSEPWFGGPHKFRYLVKGADAVKWLQDNRTIYEAARNEVTHQLPITPTYPEPVKRHTITPEKAFVLGCHEGFYAALNAIGCVNGDGPNNPLAKTIYSALTPRFEAKAANLK